MIYNNQPLTDYGFTDMYGHVWCNALVDSYNNLTEMINKSAGKEIYSNSLTHTEREFYLDQRHKLFVQFINIKRESNQARLIAQ